MSGDGIQGDTDAMREFASRVMGSLDANPVSNVARRDQETPCPGGLDQFCQVLTHEENDSIFKLQTFITQVEQGFAAYSSFVQQSAVNYLRADEAGRQEILAAFTSRREEGLPAVDPRLLEPRAGQR